MKRKTPSRDRRRPEALTKQLAELDHLYQTAPVGLCLMDRDLRFVRVNEKLAAINGKPVVEHIGRTLREVIPEIAQKVEPVYRRVIDTGEPALDFEVQGTTSGWSGTGLVSYYPLKSDDGSVRGVSTVVQDITERKRVEEATRQTEEHLRVLLETTNVIPWEAGAETWQFTYVGPQAVRLLGYPLNQWYEKDFWTSHIHPDDREYAIDFCLKSSSRSEDYEFEYRMVSSDGRILWLHDLVSVVSTDGAPKVLRGFMIDITERKRMEQALSQSEAALRHSQKDLQRLAGRLLSAQEEVHRRLARELHDDFTQRLAALAIKAGHLEQQVYSSPDRVCEQLREMKEQMVKLSTDVHRISRQLHPSILDDLGLVAAIESECTGFSEREGIPIGFTAQNAPEGLPNDASLCLYRITQESLRNIAKHAQTKDAHVTITGIDGGVLVSIRDSGVGFDPVQVRGKGGLGLASMEERVRLIQGSLSVQSQPGQGTVIEVRTPVSGRVE